MSKLGIFMADGCEEVEGLTVVDIIRRAGLEMEMISISGNKAVTGSHGIVFMADALKEDVDFDALDGIVLPGGIPGVYNLGDDETVNKVIKDFKESGKLVAAICAGPTVLGQACILEGINATCHPGFEDKLLGAITHFDPVVVDGNVITSRGMGTAIPFGLAIAEYFSDEETIEKVKKGIVFQG